VAEVDSELLAVLRLLQAASGDVRILEVIDDSPAGGHIAAQGWLFDDGAAPDEPSGAG
jgi:hypothetical protein